MSQLTTAVRPSSDRPARPADMRCLRRRRLITMLAAVELDDQPPLQAMTAQLDEGGAPLAQAAPSPTPVGPT